MANKDLMSIYFQQMNDYICPSIDLKKLEQSCNSNDQQYARETLKLMHELFVDIYGTEHLDRSHSFVSVPAVIRGNRTGRIAIGIVQLDLESSGEHYGTIFFTGNGIISQGESPKNDRIISRDFIPYSYWYTVDIPGDIHFQGKMPEEVKEISNVYQREVPQKEFRKKKPRDMDSR